MGKGQILYPVILEVPLVIIVMVGFIVVILTIETRHALSLNLSPQQKKQNQIPPQTPGEKRFQNQGKNTVSSILGSYKSAVTKHANRMGLTNGWQERFHDHIIRNDDEYQRINDYIESNPQNWEKDKFYTP